MTVAAAPRLTVGVIASAILHGGMIAAFLFFRPAPQPAGPPIYRVQLFAAPPGERAVGVVQDVPPTPTPAPETPPPPVKSSVPRPKVPTVKPKPVPQTKAATPTAPTKPAETKPAPTPQPTAAGGDEGGKGADVANIDTNGLDFPYPWYTQRITREILLRFRSTAAMLTADVRFVIQRDGTVDPASIKIVTSSRNYSFDQQALGAIESAANAKAFGALPPGFREDILPVTFRFSPSLLKK